MDNFNGLTGLFVAVSGYVLFHCQGEALFSALNSKAINRWILDLREVDLPQNLFIFKIVKVSNLEQNFIYFSKIVTISSYLSCKRPKIGVVHPVHTID